MSKTAIIDTFRHLNPITIPEDSVLVSLDIITPRLKYKKDVIGAFRTNKRIRLVRTFGHQEIREYNNGCEIKPLFSKICLNCQKNISSNNLYCNNSCSSSHLNKTRTEETLLKIKSSIRLIQGKTTTQFIEESILVYGINEYNYDKTDYVNSTIKIVLFHNKCGKYFKQSPSEHLRGYGCQKCNTSSGELWIYNFLVNNKIRFETQWHFNKHKNLKGLGTGYLSFDFYLPDYDLCIEYDGKQHFKSIEYFGGHKEFINIQRRDLLKNQFCLQNDVRLIRIPYWVNLSNIDVLSLIQSNMLVCSIFICLRTPSRMP